MMANSPVRGGQGGLFGHGSSSSSAALPSVAPAVKGPLHMAETPLAKRIKTSQEQTSDGRPRSSSTDSGVFGRWSTPRTHREHREHRERRERQKKQKKKKRALLSASRLSQSFSWTYENGRQVFLLDDDEDKAGRADVAMGGTETAVQTSTQPDPVVTPVKAVVRVHHHATVAQSPVRAVPMPLVRSSEAAGRLLPSSPITPSDRSRTVRECYLKPHTASSSPAKTAAATPDPRLVYRHLSGGPRPYLSYADRGCLLQLNERELQQKLGALLSGKHQHRPDVVHVDFAPDEIRHVLHVARSVVAATPSSSVHKDDKATATPARQLHRLRKIVAAQRPEGIEVIVRHIRLPGRTPEDLTAFLADVALQRRFPAAVASLAVPNALLLTRCDRRACETAQRTARLNALLFTRATAGQRSSGGNGRVRELGFGGAIETLRRFREDSLRLRGEWTSCAGDIATVSWTSADAFLCGTVTHMDHQYNRQGNLVLGSVGAGTLRAFPDHRVQWQRPASSSSSSRDGAGGDPWMYTSVVSSDYDAAHGLAFTAGFDRAVRAWRVDPSGASMALAGVWMHEGRVNFVATSTDAAGLMIATAADVARDAVRVYHWPGNTYRSFSCSRVADAASAGGRSWAYLPAAMRWGLAPTVRHLLLVGFSPRGLSASAEDDDIPEERQNTGELCLWDGRTGARWRLTAGASQNVFEVAWHPSQAWFAAATAPVGNAVESNVRTQIRIYGVPFTAAAAAASARASSPDETLLTELHILDCHAEDINELSLRPNSTGHLYVAAGCTDGRTYVWDTAHGGLPLHVLVHGRFIEEQSGDKISVEDTGVKFVAWGATPDRLYTGSSDGLVKVWNVRASSSPNRNGRNPVFVRNLLECKASVSFGAFSPDKSRLVVGDASGRVFLLAVEGRDGADSDDEGPISEGEEEKKDKESVPLPAAAAALGTPFRPAFRHHPPEIIRHPTPPPPSRALPEQGMTAQVDGPSMSSISAATANDEDDDSGCSLARAFLRSGRLRLVPDRTIGAVQGPQYAETGLFCAPCHNLGNPVLPLLAAYEREQQESRPRASEAPFVGRALGDLWKQDEDDDDDDDENDDRMLDSLSSRQSRISDKYAQHAENLACDIHADLLPDVTCEELLAADRGALRTIEEAVDYGFVYEDDLPDLREETECPSP